MKRDEPHSLFASWRWWIAPASLALALALLFTDPFIGDWDGLDYTLASLKGAPSSMALGRALFIFTNHAAWRIAHALFGLSTENAYLLFKYMVVVESPLAVIACWALAREVSASIRAATVAALLVATSPFYVIYSGQVMTEIPSLLLLAIALTLYLRGVRSESLWLMGAGAFILGAGVNVRETVAFYALWLIVAPLACGWKLKGRALGRIILSVLVFLIVALGPFAYFFASDFEGYRSAWYGWRESMRLEEAQHPLRLRNLLPFFVYFFLSAPLVFVTLPLAAFKEWREHRFSRALALALVGLVATFLLLLNYSTTINWRYFLTGLPALAPLVGLFLVRWLASKLKNERRAFLWVIASIALLTLVMGVFLKTSRDKSTLQHSLTKDYGTRLKLVPADAVMISGAQTIAVTYWRGMGAGTWDVIGTGSGWPTRQLDSVIDKYLSENRRVFMDMDPRFWSVCGWQEAETREFAGIEPRFHFRRVADAIYEIRPVTDNEARDEPNLSGLLPENRPADVERCGGQGRLQ